MIFLFFAILWIVVWFVLRQTATEDNLIETAIIWAITIVGSVIVITLEVIKW